MKVDLTGASAWLFLWFVGGAATPAWSAQQGLHDAMAAELAKTKAELLDPSSDTAKLGEVRARVEAAYRAVARRLDPDRFRAPVAIGAGSARLEPGKFHIADGLDMPYVVLRRGERPKDGWPLVIAMHGGGGTSKKLSGPHGWSVNSREWRVQASFAASRYPDGAIYFVPRMVDDNNGRWWRDFNVEAFEAMIRHAIVHWDVDPDRVYMLGISEGGYGAEVLSTRLSDRLAAVSAMACGSGSSIHVENLRNLPFRTDVGERDRAFGRVSNARKNHATLDRLREKDPAGYLNVLKVHEGRGHGIDYSPGPIWMFGHRRRTHPDRVVLTTYRADKRRNDRAYWLQVLEPLGQRDLYLDARIDKETNVVSVKAEATKEDGKYQSPDWQQALADPGDLVAASGLRLRIWLHESLVDLWKPVVVRVNGKERPGVKVTPGLDSMVRSLLGHGDPRRIFAAYVDILVD